MVCGRTGGEQYPKADVVGPGERCEEEDCKKEAATQEEEEGRLPLYLLPWSL